MFDTILIFHTKIGLTFPENCLQRKLIFRDKSLEVLFPFQGLHVDSIFFFFEKKNMIKCHMLIFTFSRLI